MSTETTRWWLVRHAPVVGVEGKIYGADDVAMRPVRRGPLSRHWRRRLPGDAPNGITSHLSRAKLTAQTVRDAGLADARSRLLMSGSASNRSATGRASTWDGMRAAES